MDLIVHFMLGFVSAIAGLVIFRFTGFNINGFIASFVAIFVCLPFLILMVGANYNSPETTMMLLNLYLQNFVTLLPSLVMGEAGGMIAYAIIRNFTGAGIEFG